MTRKLKKGGYTAILSVIVIAAVVILNLIVGRLPEKVRQWDMSSSRIYTLGGTTKDLMKGLDKDVTIYVVAAPDSVDKRITMRICPVTSRWRPWIPSFIRTR